jgi:hypothetical protein
MASTSYTIKDGVKLVDLLGIVRKLQNTKRTSVAHFPALVLSRAKTPWPTIYGRQARV